MNPYQHPRPKTICTVGPATGGVAAYERLIEAGTDIARIDCGCGDHSSQAACIEHLKAARRALDAPTALLMDLRGSFASTGSLEDDAPVRLYAGRQIALTQEDVGGGERFIHQDLPGLADHLHPGSTIVVDGGAVTLAVDEVAGADIICTVQTPGLLSAHARLDFPDAMIELPVLGDAQERDLRFAAEHGADYVAVPGVRSAEDIVVVRGFLDVCGGERVGVVARIDTPDAVAAAADIAKIADAVMFDCERLAILMDAVQVPVAQRRIVGLCNQACTPVCVSAQLLASMQGAVEPTRAEAADVVRAVADGADALLLSDEASCGAYPARAIETLAQIAAKAQDDAACAPRSGDRASVPAALDAALVQAACAAADRTEAVCIVACTADGRLAQLLSACRPACPIVAVTRDRTVVRRLQLCGGVMPVAGGVDADVSLQQALDAAHRSVLARGLASEGDMAVFVADDPAGGPGAGAMCITRVHDTTRSEH